MAFTSYLFHGFFWIKWAVIIVIRLPKISIFILQRSLPFLMCFPFQQYSVRVAVLWCKVMKPWDFYWQWPPTWQVLILAEAFIHDMYTQSSKEERAFAILLWKIPNQYYIPWVWRAGWLTHRFLGKRESIEGGIMAVPILWNCTELNINTTQNNIRNCKPHWNYPKISKYHKLLGFVKQQYHNLK